VLLAAPLKALVDTPATAEDFLTRRASF